MAEETRRGKSCDCGWHEGHVIFRVVLAVIVLLIVFWVGVEMGEMRAAISYGWGGYQRSPAVMYGRDGYGAYGGGVGAMPVTAPVTTTTTTVTQ